MFKIVFIFAVHLSLSNFKIFLQLYIEKIWPNPIFLHSAYPFELGSLEKYPLGLVLGYDSWVISYAHAGFRLS